MTTIRKNLIALVQICDPQDGRVFVGIDEAKDLDQRLIRVYQLPTNSLTCCERRGNISAVERDLPDEIAGDVLQAQWTMRDLHFRQVCFT